MHPSRRHARSEVVDTALRLLDDYGLADLTMRRLARELNVSPGALYWHVDSKQALLGAVADRILRSVAAVEPGDEWRDAMLAVGTALRDALLSTTDGAELVSACVAAGTSRGADDVLTRLTDAAAAADIDAAHAPLVARTLVHYVLGFTADEQSRLQWDAAGALAEEQSVLGGDPSARFAFGMRLLIAGVAHAPTRQH